MQFNNIPNGQPAKGYAGYLTDSGNSVGKKYNYDSDSDRILAALDIDWCGAQLPNSSDTAGNQSISTTEELLTLINEMNKRLYVLTAAVIALSNK